MHIGGLPEIPYRSDNLNQGGKYRLDERTERHQKITKEASGHLDHNLSHHHNSDFSFLGGLADLLDIQVNNVSGKKRDKARKRRIGR